MDSVAHIEQLTVNVDRGPCDPALAFVEICQWKGARGSKGGLKAWCLSRVDAAVVVVVGVVLLLMGGQ